MWDSTVKGFAAFLKLERGLAAPTIEAYGRDIAHLQRYVESAHPDLPPERVTAEVLRSFLEAIADLELSAATQSRMISGIRAFFDYLVEENMLADNPAQLLDSPKLKRSLPHVLSIGDIDNMLAAVDVSKPEGHRNRAIIETLYSCGLRVSELTGLRLSGLYLSLGYIRVIGKGNRERLIPIGAEAIKAIELYTDHIRAKMKIQAGAEDYLFLNRRGTPLSRVMIFLMLQQTAKDAGLDQPVYPHIFRHSFATHLVEAGADLRAVQEMLGHKSITTTEIYTHLDQKFLRSTLASFHPRF